MDDTRKLRLGGQRGISPAAPPTTNGPGDAVHAIPLERRTRLAVNKTYKMFIGGRFPRTESGRTYSLNAADGAFVANVCRGSRKDFRMAVVAARKAFSPWSQTTAYLRGQILYRVAELLEGRREQFVSELTMLGNGDRSAHREVDATIDRFVYYAGWADKYQQVFSTVNAVSSSHFNFSILEPMGVVGILAPEHCGLLGLVSNLAPAIAGGNTCVVLASESMPLAAVSLAEILHASDVPAGVVNLLTGLRSELCEHYASHMDVNAVVYSGHDDVLLKSVQERAAENFKRVIVRGDNGWLGDQAQSPYFIRDTQETKTTWHPVGA